MLKKDQKIIERLKEIENATFDEDCIKLLLIEIREKLKKETFLKEVCHFIAHSDRDQGICHKKVDVRYAKLKFIEENVKKYLTDDFVKANKDKPERFFSDLMLSYIKTERIELKLFELIILSGIDDIENELFQKYYKLNKKQVKKLVINSYKIENGHYVLKNSISPKEFLFLDDILKFIRGTVTGRPAFSHIEIINDFIKGLKKLSIQLKCNVDFDKIKPHMNDLVVTILLILHDSTFKMFDGSIAKGFLSVHPNADSPVICLMSESGKFTFPLIMTNINALEYIDLSRTELEELNFKNLAWNNCFRDERGKLKLKKYEA